MEYLTDAHALLWSLYQPKRLGAEAKKIFSDVDTGHGCIYIPAVVVAEILMVIQKGRLQEASLDHLIPYIQAMDKSYNYLLLPLLPETVIASNK